jgi:hypothetical protein
MALSPSRWLLAVVVLLIAPVCAQQLAPSKRRADKDDPRARAEYIHRQRGRAEGGASAAQLRRQAMEQREAMIRQQGDLWRKSLQRSTDSAAASGPEQANTIPINSSTWTNIGPRPTNSGLSANFYQTSSGRVSAIAVDPCDVNGETAYAGSANGGVWKTTNGGASWTSLTDTQASLATGSIAVAGTPGNCANSIVYVGTGEQSFSNVSFYGAGVLKSVNGGASWIRQTNTSPIANAFDGTTRALPGLPSIGGMSIHPTNTDLVIAAVDGSPGGVYRTANGGGLWARSTWPGITDNDFATSVGFAPNDGSVAFAGVVRINTTNGSLTGLGVYRSTDQGATFTNISSGVVAMTSGRIELAVASSTVVYALVANDASGSLSGIFKTSNANAASPTWTPVYTTATRPDFCSPQCWYDLVIAVNPQNHDQVFAGGGPSNFIQRTLNGGATWETETGNPETIHVDQHAMAFTPNGAKLYLGNDGGVYRTLNPAATDVDWDNLNTNLEITQFYRNFGLHPTDENQTLGGTQDNGMQYFSGSLDWHDVTCGDGASAVFDINNPTIAWVNCQNIDVRKVTNIATGNFTFVDDDILGNDTSEFIPPLVGDPTVAQRLYFGGTKLWQTNNGGTSWTSTANALSGSGNSGITAIAVAPSNSNIVWVGSDDGQLHRGNAALAFTPIAGITNNVRVNSIAINANNADEVYVAQAGFTGPRIWRTLNATTGPSWTDVSGTLPTVPVNDIVVDPDLLGTVYVATDLGVYFSTNSGNTWGPLANGLPNVAVFGLKLHRPSRTLRAATHGRGMWDLFRPFIGAGGYASPALDFGLVQVGSTSAPLTTTFRNNGTLSTTISNISVAGDFARVGGSCANGSVIEPGDSCTVDVTFTPTACGETNGSVSFTNNAVNAQPSGVTQAAVTGEGSVLPTNDLRENAHVVSSTPYGNCVTTTTTTAIESTDPQPTQVCVNNPPGAPPVDTRNHSVWYRYVPDTNGNAQINTIGSDFDTVVSVWNERRGVLTELGCNDDIVVGSSLQSSLTMPVQAGAIYDIMVSGWTFNDFGTLHFNLTGPAPRNITPPPPTTTLTLSRPARPQRNGTVVTVPASQAMRVTIVAESTGIAGHPLTLECVSSTLSCSVPAELVATDRLDFAITLAAGGSMKAGSHTVTLRARAGNNVAELAIPVRVVSRAGRLAARQQGRSRRY